MWIDIKDFRTEINYEEEILNCIRDNPTGLTIADINKKTGYARNTITKYLMSLEVNKKVEYKTLGMNKLYQAKDNKHIPRAIVQSFMKGILLILKQSFPIKGSMIKEMGKALAKHLYFNISDSQLEDFQNLDAKTILESFVNLYPNFDFFQDSYELSLIDLEENKAKGRYRFKNSEFIGDNEDYLFFFHAMCGVLEGFAKEKTGRHIECNVEKTYISKKKEDSYVDISVRII